MTTCWSDSKRAGFAFAALLAHDRELALVGDGVEQQARDAVLELLAPREPGENQAALVQRWLAIVRPPLRSVPPEVPPRLRALLATKVPRSLGRRLLEGAPLSRPGYALPSDLMPRLIRIARRALERECSR